MSRNGRKSRKSRIFQTGLRPDPDIPDIPDIPGAAAKEKQTTKNTLLI